MTLLGHVRTISLLEIFQFVASGGYLGALTIRQDYLQRVVTFDRGRIHSVTGAGEDRKQLGLLLHMQGKVELAQVVECLELQAETSKRFGELLVEKGYTSWTAIETALRLQMEERLFETFLWDDATYSFEEGVGSDIVSQPGSVTISAEAFLIGTAHRLDEWERLMACVPSRQTILQLRPEREDDVASLVVKRGVSFDSELVSGQQPIGHLLSLAGQSQQQNTALLHELIDRDYVAPLDPAHVDQAFQSACDASDWAAALAYLRHAQTGGTKPARLCEMEAAFFGDRRAARAGLTGVYIVPREGLSLLRLCHTLLWAGFPGVLEVATDAGRARFAFGSSRFAIEIEGREVLEPIIQSLQLRSPRTDLAQLLPLNRQKARYPVASLLLATSLLSEIELRAQLFDVAQRELQELALADDPDVSFAFGAAPEFDCNSLVLKVSAADLQARLTAPVFDLLQRTRSIPTLDMILMTRHAPAGAASAPLLKQVDGRTSMRQLIDRSRLPRRSTFEVLVGALETSKLRPVNADEMLDAVEGLLSDGRPTDALRACRAALDMDLDPPIFEQLAAAIVDVHGDLARHQRHYRFTVDLRSLSLADVLQSLHLHDKSGTLHVRRPGEDCSVYFERGDLYYVHAARKTPLSTVEDYIRKMKADAGRDAAPINVSTSLLREADAPEDLVHQVRDVVLDLLLWHDASVEFIANVFPPEFLNPSHRTLKLKLDTEHLLIRVLSVVHQWSALEQAFPADSQLVFASEEVRAQAHRDESERAVAELVDRIGDLDTILLRSPYSRTATLQILKVFHDRHWLAPGNPTRAGIQMTPTVSAETDR